MKDQDTVSKDSCQGDLDVLEFNTTDRNGMAVVLLIAVWIGRVIEINVYRASDMSHLLSKTLTPYERTVA